MNRRWLPPAILVLLLGAGGALWLSHDPAPSAPPPGPAEAARTEAAQPPGLAVAKPEAREPPIEGRPAPAADSHRDPTHLSNWFLGTIVDEVRKPLVGVEVYRTDRRGTFRMARLATSRADGSFAGEAGLDHSVEVFAVALGRALVGSVATLEAGKDAQLVMVPASVLRVRVVDDATGAPVQGTEVRAITGTWVNAAFSSESETPFADAKWTDVKGLAPLLTEGGPANVLVLASGNAPVFIPRVNVPPEGRDLEVRVRPGAVVEGRVLDSAGAPVAMARVRLEVRPLYSEGLVITGDDGRFRFTGVPSKGVSESEIPYDAAAIGASADGWASVVLSIKPPNPGETLVVDVVLPQAHRLTGVVRNANGTPASGIQVSAVAMDDPWLPILPHDAMFAITDSAGLFEFTDAPAGRVHLRAGARDEPVEAQATVDVPEKDVGPPIVLVLPDRRGRLTVHVVDGGGAPVAGVRIEVRSGPPVIGVVGRGTTDTTGAVKIEGLPTNEAAVYVIPPGSVAISRAVKASELAGGEVIVRLDDGIIAGHALMADGTPAHVRMSLQCLIGVCMERGDAVQTDADGRFEFRHVPEGTFQAHVEGEENVIVSLFPHFSPGERDAKVWIAGVEELARFHLEVVLLYDSDGRPFDPAARFMAEFEPADGVSGRRFNMSQASTSSEPGRFVSYSAIPPGVYDVTFTTQGWRAARLKGVRIPRVGEAPVVRLENGLRVEGRVTSKDGRPFAGVGVVIGPDLALQGATTNEDGLFLISGLEAGEQGAEASGDLVVAEKRKVRVPLPGKERLEWTLQSAGALQVEFGVLSTEGGVERVLATPLAGGVPLEDQRDGRLTWDGRHHGAKFGGIAAGRYRVEAWQGKNAFPPQEVDVRLGERAVVAFPAK